MIQNPTLLLDDLLLDVIEPYYTLRCYRTLLYSKMFQKPTLLLDATEPYFTLRYYRTLLYSWMVYSTHYIMLQNPTLLLMLQNPALLLMLQNPVLLLYVTEPSYSKML